MQGRPGHPVQPNAYTNETEARTVWREEVKDCYDDGKKWIQVKAECEILMLKAVTPAEAHSAPLGEIQMRFKKLCGLFVESSPSVSLITQLTSGHMGARKRQV